MKSSTSIFCRDFNWCTIHSACAPQLLNTFRMNNAAQKELSRKEYWDARYQKESQPSESNENEYEWFKKFGQLRPFFAKYLPDISKDPRILQLGCGTSVGISLLDDYLLDAYILAARLSQLIFMDSATRTRSAWTFPVLLSRKWRRSMQILVLIGKSWMFGRCRSKTSL